MMSAILGGWHYPICPVRCRQPWRLQHDGTVSWTAQNHLVHGVDAHINYVLSLCLSWDPQDLRS